MSRLPIYRDVAGSPDASDIAGQVAGQRARVAARLAPIRHIAAVASGKGGVGKSWVAAQLARRLAAQGKRVGLLDADLNGPTVPRLAGIGRAPLAVTDGVVHPVLSAEGVRVFSPAFLVPADEPVRWREPGADGFVWRGALEAGTLREMLADVAWGTLDLLLVDLPPGHQRLDDLHTLVPQLAGMVAVTIPSPEAADAVRRALTLARERGVPLLGIIENMAEHVCPSCGQAHAAFRGAAGAALAAEFGIPRLAGLAFDPPAHAIDAMTRAVWEAIAR